MKIRPVGAELFHADRQTDMTKLIVTFRSIMEAHKTTRIKKRFDVTNSANYNSKLQQSTNKMHTVCHLHIHNFIRTRQLHASNLI
jgi:hypothetical protein